MITTLAALSFVLCSPGKTDPLPPVGGPSAAQIHAAFEELRYEAVTQIGTPFTGVDSAWQAPNRAHGLRTFFLPEGVRVRPRRGDPCGWALDLSLAAHGRGTELVAAEPVAPVVDGAFVEYRRGPLTEWYFNDAMGLEQGFTLEAPPAGTGPLVLVLQLGGDFRAEIADEHIALRGPGQAALRLDELCVLDAEGRGLEARFEPDPLGVRIVVDDDGAAYPMTVDPLLINVGTQLERPFYVEQQLFGTSVAVHGSSAAVGGPGDEGMMGVVHTWRWSGSFWQAGARIVPPAGEPGDRFGQAVSIVDGILLVGAPGTDVQGIDGAGQAYVYQQTGSLPQDWSLWATLPHPDAAFDDGFGSAVALRNDGARLYVGAPQKFSGWAYLFALSGSSWAKATTLAPVSGVPAEFGSSISYDVPTSMVLIGGPAMDGEKGKVWGFNDSTSPLIQRTFQPSDLLPGDRFGASIAHQGDWTVFGAPGHDAGAAEGGAAYVWEQITSLVWVQRFKVLGAQVGGELGRAVDVWTETNGDGRVALGEPGGGPSQEGAVHVYRAAPTVLTLIQQLVRSDGTSGDGHGSSVALDGDLLLAGAPHFDQTLLGPHPSVDSGRACTYSFDGSVWSEEFTLHAPELVIGDRYGQGVALAGNWAAVGASGDDTAATGGGTVFLFEQTAPQAWTLQQKLMAGTGAVPSGQFGYTVALQGDELFVSHGGVDEVWAYRRQGGVWSLEAQIAGVTAPLVPHQFDASGDRMIVRSHDLIGGTFPRGAATIFQRVGTAWFETAYLDDPSLPLLNKFGTDYTIEGDLAVVGCSTDDLAGAEAGMARVFVHDGADWLFESELRPAGLQAGDRFGAAVDLSDGVLAVSATQTDVGGVRAGAVYAFARSGSAWIEEAQFVSANPQDLGYFGWSLALDGALLIVGAPFEDANSLVDHGRVYVFQRFSVGWTLLEELQGIWFKFGTSVDVSGHLAVGGAPEPTGWAGAYELNPAPALVYCTAKVNSQGCTPGIEWAGTPSVSAASGFDIACIHNRDGVNGTFFYGVNGSKVLPYQGGYLCVVGPVKRTGLQNSGGVGNCNGEFHYDFNARIASGVDPSLVAGQTVWGQYWSRDSLSSFGSNRSDAIEFVIQP